MDDNITPELITPVQSLMNVINNKRDTSTSHPADMPEDQQDAAKWWINLNEPARDNEKPSLEWTTPRTGGKERYQFWRTPYIYRLKSTLIIFYKLNRSDQLYILDLIYSGIWWRGDSIAFMKVRENVGMKEISKGKTRSMITADLFGAMP